MSLKLTPSDTSDFNTTDHPALGGVDENKVSSFLPTTVTVVQVNSPMQGAYT